MKKNQMVNTSGGNDTRNPGFWDPQYHGLKVPKLIFQSGAYRRHCGTLKNHELWQQKWVKNEERPRSTCLQPFFC